MRQATCSSTLLHFSPTFERRRSPRPPRRTFSMCTNSLLFPWPSFKSILRNGNIAQENNNHNTFLAPTDSQHQPCWIVPLQFLVGRHHLLLGVPRTVHFTHYYAYKVVRENEWVLAFCSALYEITNNTDLNHLDLSDLSSVQQLAAEQTSTSTTVETRGGTHTNMYVNVICQVDSQPF